MMRYKERVRTSIAVRVLLPLVVVACTGGLARAAEPDADSGDDAPYIEYQLRPNEDPSKVAKMFHVTLESLMALNNISDPHRLAAGIMLKIPDPRASVVQQLQAEKAALETRLSTTQGGVAGLQKNINQLQGQVNDLREANDGLQTEHTLYQVWRSAVFVSGGTAIVLAFAVLVAWGKSRDAERRREAAHKQIEVLRVAVDKYRQLSAQFELKYQSLFHQVGMPAVLQTRAQALRGAYDDDRARLDAIVTEAEQQITNTLEKLSAKREDGRSPARLAALAAVRKS
jgi:LysM repeat protein